MLLGTVGHFQNEEMEWIDECEEEWSEEQWNSRDPACLFIVALLRQPLDEVPVLHAIDLTPRLDERLRHHCRQKGQEANQVDDHEGAV